MSNTGTDIKVQEAKFNFIKRWNLRPNRLYISDNLYRYLLTDLFATMDVDHNKPVVCFGMTVVIVKQDNYLEVSL